MRKEKTFLALFLLLGIIIFLYIITVLEVRIVRGQNKYLIMYGNNDIFNISTKSFNTRSSFFDFSRNNTKKIGYKIENIVHFIWYAETHKELLFRQYLAILSAHKFQKPDHIYFHTNCAPVGKYWDWALKIPKFVVRQEEPPHEVFGETIKAGAFHTSDSNVARVKILMEEGGIYLDMDAWIVRSLDPLRHYDCVLGEELKDVLCSSVVLCNQDAMFLKLWMEHFISDYHPEKWGYNSGIVPSRLASRYPQLVHIEKRKLQHPSYNEMERLYGNKPWPWQDNYTVHLWITFWTKWKKHDANITEASIPHLNSTVGQIARHIFYD